MGEDAYIGREVINTALAPNFRMSTTGKILFIRTQDVIHITRSKAKTTDIHTAQAWRGKLIG